MTQTTCSPRSGCPISCALDVFGDKWTLLIIRDMVFLHKRHFREFLTSPEKIASNILADRLKTLEASAIISRRPDPTNARRIVYELTRKGEDLIPALLELLRWGAKHDAPSGAPEDFVRRIENDRQGFLAEIKAALRRARTPRRRPLAGRAPRCASDCTGATNR